MLSSPHWTTLDAYLVILLAIFLLRAGPDRTDQAQTKMEEERHGAVIRALGTPLPEPAVVAGNSQMGRFDVSLRCLGLVEHHREQACRGDASNACWQARDQVRDMERSLWPKGRTGQMAMAFRSHAGIYARAYRALTEGRSTGTGTSSQLILRRDSAMCREYREIFEARLHEHQNRQPG